MKRDLSNIIIMKSLREYRAKTTTYTSDNRLSKTDICKKAGDETLSYDLDETYWKERAEEEISVGISTNAELGGGIDNFIIIDTSSSMKPEGIWQARYAILSLLDEFEGTPFTRAKENVVLIACGYTTTILQHLTCNYNEIKRCLDCVICGGASPLLAGLIFCEVLNNAGRGRPMLYGDTQWRIHPRIILISDGRATDPFCINGQEGCDDDNKVKTKLYTYVEQIHMRIYSVPVGQANREVLGMLSVITNGKVVELQDVRTKLGRYYPNFTVAERLYTEYMSLDWTRISRSDLRMKLGSYKSRTDQDLDTIKAILIQQNETDTEGRDGKNTDLENLEMPPLGSRVRRGPDWQWGNQDDCGAGTVTAHFKNGWLRVVWDNGSGYSYRFGSENAIDVTIVDEPRSPRGKKPDVGCMVVRGPNWDWGDQDGGEGNIGSIYLIDRNVVYVRWPNGHKGNYRYNYNGKYDVHLWYPKDREDREEKERSTHSRKKLSDSKNVQNMLDGVTEKQTEREGENTLTTFCKSNV